MVQTQLRVTDGWSRVVGSFGKREDLRAADAAEVRACCDIAEIRLDLIMTGKGGEDPEPWRHLQDIPLLFTARRQDEGGARALSAKQRLALLEPTLAQAAWLDLEVASIGDMGELLQELARRKIPWLASFHDFKQMPARAVLEDAAHRALDAGASVFKAAAMLRQPADLARLAEFQLADHGLPVASMGMGPLAAVSRLLCAQCGSVLNYGYLGKTATAPGQWDAALLKETIARLMPLRS
jgi:3-dehydroquinate dehydratase-1